MTQNLVFYVFFLKKLVNHRNQDVNINDLKQLYIVQELKKLPYLEYDFIEWILYSFTGMKSPDLNTSEYNRRRIRARRFL
jgi:hypothetical protein